MTFFNFFHIEGTLGIVLLFFSFFFFVSSFFNVTTLCHYKEEYLNGSKLNLDILSNACKNKPIS